MLKNRISWFSLLTTLLIFFSCSDNLMKVEDAVLSVKEHFAPDSRTAIFNVTNSRKAGEYMLTGETDNIRAMSALLDTLERLNLPYRNMIQVLPEEQLGNRTWAIVNVSVANIRRDPKHSSELVTQANLGTLVKLLKKKNGWYLIQTPDQYLGWVDSGGIRPKSVEEVNFYKQHEKIIFKGIYGFSYQIPAEDSTTVSDLTSGNILILEENHDLYYKVSYPDGRLAFIRKTESEVFSEWIQNISPDGEHLVSSACELLGIPYLWGGTSSKAMDCSGFTKVVYFLNGIVLPRDASQQESIGTFIDDKKGFNNLKKGDLLFFGNPVTDSTNENVVHVGMWIGDMQFIHASGDVHISSMDSVSSIFDEYNLNRYLRTRRLIGSGDDNNLSVRNGFFETW